jgi:general secretion pathway protein B
MSFILDALRKSEQERRQTDSLVLTSGPSTIELPRRRLAPLAAGAFAIVVALAVILYWTLLERRTEPVPALATVTSTTAARAPESSAAPATATAPMENSRAVADIPVAPELKPYPLMQTRETPGARALADEAQVEPRQSTRMPRTTPPTNTIAVAPADIAPNPPRTEPVKFLRTMPSDFQRSLPELTVNIHIYAPREADRILYINNRQYHSGDRVGDGIVVEDIVEDGAILSFHGQQFKLPRPS